MVEQDNNSSRLSLSERIKPISRFEYIDFNTPEVADLLGRKHKGIEDEYDAKVRSHMNREMNRIARELGMIEGEELNLFGDLSVERGISEDSP